jgi:hypothetical protein
MPQTIPIPAIVPVVIAVPFYAAYIADEAIAIGDTLALVATTGRVVKANASLASGRERVMGVAVTSAGGAGFAVDVAAPGDLVSVRTSSALAAVNNGLPLYQDTVSGSTSLTPPWATGDTMTVIVAVLQGADGVTLLPMATLQLIFQEVNP